MTCSADGSNRLYTEGITTEEERSQCGKEKTKGTAVIKRRGKQKKVTNKRWYRRNEGRKKERKKNLHEADLQRHRRLSRDL